MTPQERDLITALIDRLHEQANQPRDPDAEALIRRGVAAQPDIPYLLVQTVLIQDMALQNAQHRVAELESELASVKTTPQAPTSFLGNAARNLGFAGPWGRAPAASQPPSMAAAAGAPFLAQSGGSGFLRQAAATAAGVAGGALLFESVQSLFGARYGGGFLGGLQQQPGISETVINNYYGDRDAAGTTTDAGARDDTGQQNDGDLQNADYTSDPRQDDSSDQDVADGGFDQGFGGDDGGGTSDA